MIYTEFLTWRKAAEYRFGMLFKGLYGVVFLILIMGGVSVLYYVIRQVNAFFRRETVAACIVTAIIFLMAFGWASTFIRERCLRIEAQHVADSIAYDFSKYTQMFDTTEAVVINGDTIKCWK